MHLSYAGLNGIRLSLDGVPSPTLTADLLELRDRLTGTYPTGITDCVMGYRTLTLFFDLAELPRETLLAAIRNLDGVTVTPKNRGRIVELPVWYAEESGHDLLSVAEYCGRTVEEVIDLHSRGIYNAYATGFAPGFCYLGDTPEVLEIPRLRTPRRTVPAGSVAIADRQTAVYPSASPGGWRLLGLCPTPLFNLVLSPPGLIAVGDAVTFKPISRDEFFDLGGTVI
jgi:KipI family sensor histidine kinase inhibitor